MSRVDGGETPIFCLLPKRRSISDPILLIFCLFLWEKVWKLKLAKILLISKVTFYCEGFSPVLPTLKMTKNWEIVCFQTSKLLRLCVQWMPFFHYQSFSKISQSWQHCLSLWIICRRSCCPLTLLSSTFPQWTEICFWNHEMFHKKILILSPKAPPIILATTKVKSTSTVLAIWRNFVGTFITCDAYFRWLCFLHHVKATQFFNFFFLVFIQFLWSLGWFLRDLTSSKETTFSSNNLFPGQIRFISPCLSLFFSTTDHTNDIWWNWTWNQRPCWTLPRGRNNCAEVHHFRR